MQAGGHGANSFQHDPSHRKGVSYRDQETANQFSRGGSADAAKARENFRGHGGANQFSGGSGTPGGAGRSDFGARGRTQTGRMDPAPQRHRQSADGRQRPRIRTQLRILRRSGFGSSAGAVRIVRWQSASHRVGVVSSGRSDAFSGASRGGSAAQSSSNRGYSSRSSGGGGGGAPAARGVPGAAVEAAAVEAVEEEAGAAAAAGDDADGQTGECHRGKLRWTRELCDRT